MNIVLLLADQLRADCVGVYGNAIVRTPHIDRLAAEGTRFDQCFAQHPQCAPSRASFMTGRYPHANGCISNYVAMSDNEQTIGEFLRANGYATLAAGKLHLFERKNQSSFERTQFCGGQNSDAVTPDVLCDDYKDWLKANGYWELAVDAYRRHGTAEYHQSFQAISTCIPVEAYVDCWTGDRAVKFIGEQDDSRPFFLFAGFPNPHNPFDPPEPYASMYKPEDMPIPLTFHSDLSQKPPQQLRYKLEGRANIGADYGKLTKEKLQKVVAYYYASITLVDDQVGKIIAALERKGILDDTLIVFTSDHGELLGHHGLLLKSTDAYPILYDKSLHVPLVCRFPGAPKGRVVEKPVELVDLFPTFAEAASLETPPEVQGSSLLPAIHGGDAPEKNGVFAESGAVKMLRRGHYKIVHYPGQEYGELYDIREDPDELHNLYASPEYRMARETMTRRLLDRLILTEASRHGQSKRGPAYWRKSYRMPFE